jgi:hypothetical protein
MNEKCHTGRELDCPFYSMCRYDSNDRLISNCDPLKPKNSWEYEARHYSCQDRDINLNSLLRKKKNGTFSTRRK